MIVPLLSWSILMLAERRTTAAWCGWWAACSIFQYSSAGEKVPWLAVHIILPIYFAMGWVWAPWLRRAGALGRRVALAALLVAMAVALLADLRFFGENAAHPRERVVYNHTPYEFDRFVKRKLAQWQDTAHQVPLKQRRVLLVADTGWPGVWYFRDCRYDLIAFTPPDVTPYDLVLGTSTIMEPLFTRIDAEGWNVRGLSLRDHWWGALARRTALVPLAASRARPHGQSPRA